MQRRGVDLGRDYAELLAMQRLSWQVNFPDHRFNEGVFRAALRGALRRGEATVYELRGQIIAFLWLDLRASSESGHIKHVQVLHDLWGQGLGRLVMEDAIAACRSQGLKYLSLNVTKSNLRAMRLYEDLGFGVTEDHGERQRMRLSLCGAAAEGD